MPEETQPHTELHALIDQGVELLLALEKLLLEERRALEQRELEAITQCTEDKSTLLEQIDANFRARHQWLTAQGIDPSATGWQSFLQQQPASIAELLGHSWQTLADTLQRVQKSSLINQQLVRRSQENTGRLLSILQGKNQRSQLYSSSGQSDSFSTQSHIGKA